MLNAIRYCFTKRGRSKKPDWLLDKHPHRSRSKSIPSEDVPSDASTANILCTHLSVDPSLPSHYRVCDLFEWIERTIFCCVCLMYLFASFYLKSSWFLSLELSIYFCCCSDFVQPKIMCYFGLRMWPNTKPQPCTILAISSSWMKYLTKIGLSIWTK